MELDSQGDDADCDLNSSYGEQENAAFWARRAAILRSDRELYVVNQPGDSHNNVAGLDDAEDTSDEELDNVKDVNNFVPVSPYVDKRPCELRGELETQNELGIMPVDVDAVVRRCTMAYGPEVYQQPGFKAFRERLHKALLAAVDEHGIIQTEGLTERLRSVVVTKDEVDAGYSAVSLIEPCDGGAGDKRTSSSSKQGKTGQDRTRSPTKGTDATTPTTATATGHGHKDNGSDD